MSQLFINFAGKNATMKLFFLFCLSFYVAFAKYEQYNGHVLYEVYPRNVEDIQLVHDVVNELDLDIWTFASLNYPGEIFVSKLQIESFENSLEALGVPYEATIANIKELLEKEEQTRAALPKTYHRGTNLTFDHVYTYEEVNDYLEAFAEAFPNVANVSNAGFSVENRTIKILEISTTGFQQVGKPIIFLQALLHAREWVTLAPLLHAIRELLYEVKYSDLLNYIDWVIMPVANPDGYVFSHTDDRFWRKNRRINRLSTCVGVDLNRNFDIDWGTLSSSNPCSNTFHGTGPTSEPEIQAITNIFNKYDNRIAMYEDIHSTGSMILYGWGNGSLIPNALVSHVCGVRMAEAIDHVKWDAKPYYRVGNTLAVIGYTVSGGSSDFAQSRGVPYSHTYELPAHLGGIGVDRFLVAPAFIKQAAVETWAGLVAGARFLIGRV